MSENYEIHIKDRTDEIHIKGPTEDFVRRWWEILSKKLERNWGTGAPEPEKRKTS